MIVYTWGTFFFQANRERDSNEQDTKLRDRIE